jgi:hypothetical protein
MRHKVDARLAGGVAPAVEYVRMTTSSEPRVGGSDEDHLHRMLTIVGSNAKSAAFVNELWEAFSGRIKCEIIADDGRPSVLRFEHRTSNGMDRSEAHLILRENSRLEEAMIHELLHADLFRCGYPKFYLRTQREGKWQEGADILNLADHVVMLPTFLSLGYADERFVGPSEPMSEEGQRVQADLRALKDRLSTPEGYTECLCEYLRNRGIEFSVIPSGSVHSR